MSNTNNTPSACLPSNIGKINRIHKAELSDEQTKAARSTKACLLTSRLPQVDYLSIYKNMTVLFIGDNSIRTLFRDLCKVLTYDRLLDYTEAACQHGKYKPIENEKVVVCEGKIGSDQYRDVRQFYLEKNSTRLIYIHLATLNNLAKDNLNYLKQINPKISIDLIIFCSFEADINKRKIENAKLSSDEHFAKYLVELDKFSSYLSKFCVSSNKTQHSFWLSPLPDPINVSSITSDQFEHYIKETYNVVKMDNFVSFDRYDIWQRRKDLTIPGKGYLSLHGVREISDTFTRLLASKINRPFTSSIPLPITPLSHLNDMSSANIQWSKPISTSVSTATRFHPYSR